MFDLRKLPIGTQLLYLAISTIVSVALIIAITYLLTAKTMLKNKTDSTKQILYQIKLNISSECDSFNRILKSIAYNSVVQDYLMETDPLKKNDIFKTVNNLVNNMQGLNEGIIDIAMVGKNGNKYFQKGETAVLKEILDSIPQNSQRYYTKVEMLEYEGQKKYYFIVASDVFSISITKMTGMRIGRIALIINAKTLGLNDKLVDSAVQYYFLDRDKNVYSSNNIKSINQKFELYDMNSKSQSGFSSLLINRTKFIVNDESIPEIGGKVICLVPEKELYHDVYWILRTAIIIFILTVLILSIPFTIIISNILSPLRQFMSFILKIKSGDLKGLKNKINLKGYVEIETMAEEFNSLLDKIDNLTYCLVDTSSKLYEAEIEKKQSELAFLQSQINPHFLYNTLDSISGIAAVNGNRQIFDMTEALSQIFKYSIRGENEVIFRDELNITKYYIQIQQIRFAFKFEVLYDLQEEVLECWVLKMILQPIIENAVFHGLEPKIDKGYLLLRGCINDQRDLYLCIEDNGIGIGEVELLDLKKRLSSGTAKKGNEKFSTKGRIGLVNVDNRIKLSFGLQYGIDIESLAGKGTRVTLKMPWRRAGNV